jgi:hypothetical protein
VFHTAHKVVSSTRAHGAQPAQCKTRLHYLTSPPKTGLSTTSSSAVKFTSLPHVFFMSGFTRNVVSGSAVCQCPLVSLVCLTQCARSYSDASARWPVRPEATCQVSRISRTLARFQLTHAFPPAKMLFNAFYFLWGYAYSFVCHLFRVFVRNRNNGLQELHSLITHSLCAHLLYVQRIVPAA